MSGTPKSAAEKISALFEKTVRGNQRMESWLYNDFPHGLQQILDRYDKDSMDIKAHCDEMFHDCHMTGMSFSDPKFDGQYSIIQRLYDEVTLGRMAQSQAFGELRTYKEPFDEVTAQRVFFVQEFLPRLQELQQGAELNRGDYELFYLASQKSKTLAPRYNKYVTGEFKPGDGTYASYMNFLKVMLDTIPEPPDWKKRMIALNSHATTSPPSFGNF